MKTFIRMICVAVVSCGFFISNSSAWYNQYEAQPNTSTTYQSDYVSVPSASWVDIYGTSQWNEIASGYALLRVSTPSQTIDCYTYYSAYSNNETNEAFASNQAAGTYHVEFTAEIPATNWGANVHYDVTIDW